MGEPRYLSEVVILQSVPGDVDEGTVSFFWYDEMYIRTIEEDHNLEVSICDTEYVKQDIIDLLADKWIPITISEIGQDLVPPGTEQWEG